MEPRHTVTSLARPAALGGTETAGGNETWGVSQQSLGQVIRYPT